MTLELARMLEAPIVRAGAGLLGVTVGAIAEDGLGSGRFVDRFPKVATMKDVPTIANAVLPDDDAPPPVASGFVRTAVSFETMAEQNLDFVFRCLRRSGLDEATSDDAVQQVFVIASQKLASIEPGKEKAFLYGAARNVAAQHRRAHARRAEVEYVEPSEHDDGTGVSASGPTLDELLDQRRARELLDEVLASLPDLLRDVFVLSEVEELSAPEVAACLEIPVGTVASRLARAREAFDQALARIQKRRAFRGAR
jgi:RNA polymerase sigma-70 factor (ECF subfamily)